MLKENNYSGAKDLMAALNHVADLEQQLSGAVQELTSMRQELQDMQKSPLKTALQKPVQKLETKVNTLRQQIDTLKENIIEGCKQALADFKERGTVALDSMARFFHLRQGLEGVQETIKDCLHTDEKALATIAAVSSEYHEAGKHLKNVGRAIVGKDTIQEAKAPGKLAKAISAPYQAERSCMLAMQKSVDKALSSIGRLEQAAEKKPSILKTMKEQNEKIQSEPVREAPTARNAER